MNYLSMKAEILHNESRKIADKIETSTAIPENLILDNDYYISEFNAFTIPYAVNDILKRLDLSEVVVSDIREENDTLIINITGDNS